MWGRLRLQFLLTQNSTHGQVTNFFAMNDIFTQFGANYGVRGTLDFGPLPSTNHPS